MVRFIPIAALSLMLAGCGSASLPSSPYATESATATGSPTASPTTSPARPPASGDPSPVASQAGLAITSTDPVISAFEEAGLPLPDQRDTSQRCAESVRGCVERITSENVSVLAFATEDDAIAYQETFGDDAFRRGLIVLQYAAARTPEADRAAYEQAVEDLIPAT